MKDNVPCVNCICLSVCKSKLKNNLERDYPFLKDIVSNCTTVWEYIFISDHLDRQKVLNIMNYIGNNIIEKKKGKLNDTIKGSM